MARTSIAKGSWVSLGTTTVNTLFGVEGGNVRFFTGSTTGVTFELGVEVKAGDNIVFPAGLPEHVSMEKH